MRDNVVKVWHSTTIKTHEMWLIVLFGKLGRSVPFEWWHLYILSYSETEIFPGYICNMHVLWVGLPRRWTKTSIWSKSTSIKTSWSLPLRCRQRLEASHAMQCMSALLWFAQNIIASDCLCFYWIRPALLMRKEINKQTVLSLAGMVKLLSQFQRWFVLWTRTSWCIYLTFVLVYKYCS